jgi:hypoxanthine phosphoribosyltransferase
VQIKDLEFKPYIYEKELEAICAHLGSQINHDYRSKTPILVGVLNGCFMFLTDLVKNLNIPLELEFIKVRSYQGTQSTGQIHFDLDIKFDVKDRDIILVEDIVDTGLTIQYLLEEFKKLPIRSLEICSLLYKPDSFKGNYSLKYCGKVIPNAFVIGYGLDYDGLGRNLRDIFVLEK